MIIFFFLLGGKAVRVKRWAVPKVGSSKELRLLNANASDL